MFDQKSEFSVSGKSEFGNLGLSTAPEVSEASDWLINGSNSNIHG